jgi:hypothetical protein
LTDDNCSLPGPYTTPVPSPHLVPFVTPGPFITTQVAETLPAEVLEKMHAPPKAEDVPIVDPHTINQVRAHSFTAASAAREGCANTVPRCSLVLQQALQGEGSTVRATKRVLLRVALQ